MACLVEELRNTEVARWHEAVLGESATGAAAGYQTRLRYYQALLSCLYGGEGALSPVGGQWRPHEVREAVTAAAGAGSASTLYTLTGPRAPAALLANVGANLTGDPGQRRDAVVRLAAEVKVWCHWPYRSRWLAGLAEADWHCRQVAAATLVSELAAWSRANGPLAASFGCEPPLSAVEDLVVVAAGRASGEQVRGLLARVVGLAAGPFGTTPAETVDAVKSDLADLDLAGSPTVRELADRLTESATVLLRLWSQLPADERTELHAAIGPDLVGLAALVGAGSLGVEVTGSGLAVLWPVSADVPPAAGGVAAAPAHPGLSGRMRTCAVA